HYSPNTQIAYSYALTEFFEWAAAHHDRIVSPEGVTRVDTEQYVNWLANRDFSIADEKLKDGDKPDLLKLFNIVQQLGSAKLQDIIKHLDSDLQRKYFGEGGSREQAQLNRKMLSA